MNELLNYLKKCQFSEMVDERLLPYIDIVSLNKGDKLIKKGEKLKYLYYVIYGRASVDYAIDNGKTATITFIETDDIIGDIEYFNKDDYYYDVYALTEIRLFRLNLDGLKGYDNYKAYEFLCYNLAHKLKRTSIRVSSNLTFDLLNLTSKYILDRYLESGKLVNKFDQQLAADFLGVSTRHFRRILKQLEDDKIIIRKRREIEIINLKKLKTLSTQ